MKRIYSSNDLLMIGHLKNLLENHDIACILKNEHTSNLPTFTLSSTICPEIWVIDDSRYLEAQNVIEKALHSNKISEETSWRCSKCNEIMEPQFSECWNCGQSKSSNNIT